jgi:hypothetical protein
MITMAQTIATDHAEPMPPMSGLPRAPSEIPAENVRINAEGQCWRQLEVRMPATGIFADLGDNKIWKLVQNDRRVALQKGDELRIIDYFEGWIATAIVVGANHESVTISKPQRIDYAARTEILHGDEKYNIVWSGNGHRVRRKSDGHFVTYVFPTPEAAERAMHDLYPKPAHFRG